MLKSFLTTITDATNRGIRAHLEWLFRITSRRPLLVIGISIVLLALSGISIATTRFESDIFKLFPSHQGPLKLFLDSLKWSGGAQDAYFILEGSKERLIAEGERFAGRLTALQVDGQPAFRKVTYRTFDPAEAQSFADFVGYAVAHPQLFVSPGDAGRFAKSLTPGAMAGSLDKARAELTSQAGMGLREIIAADPFSLRELILPRLKKGSQALDLDTTSPYFLSRDGRVLIIIAEPARPVQDMAFARKLVTGINEARQGATVTITCTGAHLAAVLDEAAVKGNVISCVLSSLVVVLLLFYLTYRRFLPTLLIPLILFCGVVLALGTAGLFLSSISLISFAFTALIIGLGTDYSIHIYDRFHSERSAGLDTTGALRLAVMDTGHGVFTAAATTAFPFLALTISDVRALSELGLLVGLGVIFSLYATFLFLPPLLLFSERRFPATVYRPLPRFGLGWLWEMCLRRYRAVIPVSAALVALLLVATFFIRFEGDLKNLQPRHSEAFQAQEKIEQHLSLSPKQLLVAVEGSKLEDVMARGGRVEKLAERYVRGGQLVSFSSLGQVVNDRENQQEVLAAMVGPLGSLRVAESANAALSKAGFDPAPFEGTVAGLAALTTARPVPPAEAIERIERSPLRGIVARHLMRGDGSYHLLFYLNYRGSELDQRLFLKELAAADPTARATSTDLVSGQLAGSVKKSFLWGFLLGGTMVLFLLLSHFESLADIFTSLFPVFAGVIAMLGLMALTGMGVNFMNAMVLVTILGMGSDYGLHVVHRVTGVAAEERREQFVQSGRAVFLSALTTIAGFGSLAFTDYGALSSIGWATNFGIGATMLFSLVALPAFMEAGRRQTAQKNGALPQ
ncbi:MMPL family transporter [Geobacter sp. AOG1]|uniref:MMPL family transporter n=1 Tax=Geobacter sp. AOG1 TaxID=1566346 RepID=UPI001CC7CCA2|nr:MMPL family transporter [Geobacter sp. AOG1]GFE56340.1 exporter [Geobacter sp. AOG1]